MWSKLDNETVMLSKCGLCGDNLQTFERVTVKSGELDYMLNMHQANRINVIKLRELIGDSTLLTYNKFSQLNY